MSYEAWGSPPDPEPKFCPVCDSESHLLGCELGEMQKRALSAELKCKNLLAALRQLITTRMGAEQIREGIQRAIANAKGASS